MFSGLPGDEARGAGGDRHRARLEEMVHDGEVVDREVPDHVHVALEQPEVHPRGVVVVELAQLARPISPAIACTAPV